MPSKTEIEMLRTTEYLIDHGLGAHVFTESDFKCLFAIDRPQKQYALINKALHKKELVRLCRGTYVLAAKYRAPQLNPFSIACQMVQGSYVSLESALSYHGWIPERVETISCVLEKGRTRAFTNTIAHITYFKIPFNDYEFLNGILRVELLGKPFFIAGPLRALCDLIYKRKIEQANLEYCLESLRIEKNDLRALTSDDFTQLMSVYRSKRILQFLASLKTDLRK